MHHYVRHVYESGSRNNLSELNANPCMHAHDAEDRVYGVLGLMRVSNVAPDYFRPVHDVYRDVTMQIITTER
jgi:hypothetical protein